MQSLAKRIKQLVSKGKVQNALVQLQNIDAFDEKLQSQITMLNGRYHQLKEEWLKGIISQESFDVKNNRIADDLLSLVDRFPSKNFLLEFKLNRLAKSLNISIEQVKTVIGDLEERYKSRLFQKMDDYLALSLQLSYTQEGTDGVYVETYFDEESKGTDFIKENCLDVLKQHQHLLILGDPGAGKTTLLLQLANGLLQQYETLQIPIVFNLATWTKEEKSFKDWLKNILVNGYGFSPELAEKSLVKKTILPLLDGFDEVGKMSEENDIRNDIRRHCLEAIDQYVSDENVPQFIICSRRKEYQAVQQNAPIRAEILVNPISIQQIEKALAQRKKGENVKERIFTKKLPLLKEQNHPLLEVLRTPFYFNLIFDTEEMTQVLIGIDDFPQKKEEIEEYLLQTFIDRKINDISIFPKAKYYLSWLAHWMNSRGAVSFELADLQPSILKRRWFFGLVYGLVFGLVVGLVVGLNKNLKIQTEDIRQTQWSNLISLGLWGNILKQAIKRALQLGLILGLVLGLVFGLVLGLVVSLVLGLVFGLVVGLVVGLGLGLVESLYQVITTITLFKTIKKPYTRLKSGWQIYIIQSLIIGVFSLILLISLFGLQNNFMGFFLLVVLPISLFVLMKMPLIQHFILRIGLALEKKAPLKYVKFLNAATKARILEKDGGHWRFRHQLIQDYFGELYSQGQIANRPNNNQNQ